MTTQEFVKKYNIGTTFEKMYEAQYKANKMKNFTFKDEYFVSDKNTYLEGLRYMLSAYIANKINPKNIDIGVDQEFNFIEFFRDYEDAKRDEFEKSGSTREREPFEGVRDEALNTMKRCLRAFKKPTIKVWAEAIKNGAKLDSFREATIVAGEAYLNVDRKPIDEATLATKTKDLMEAGIAIDDFNGVTAEKVKEPNKRSDMLTYAVYAAMKQVRESRSFWWKIWYPNWSRNSEEKALMKELEARVKSIGKVEKDLLYNQCEMNAVDVEKIAYFDEYIKHPDLDVDDVLHFNLEETKDENFFELDNEDLDLINNLSINKEQMKKIGEQKKHQSKNKANNKPKKVEEKKVEEKKETIRKATKRSDVRNLHLMNKSEITAKFVNMLAKSGFDKGNNIRIASLLYQNLLAHINDTWANPNDMQVNAKKMFKVVYNHLNNNIREMNVGDKLVAAQRMTDLTLNTFSPVAADPKLARYGDNFAIKSMDDEDIQKITNYSGDVESLMKQVKSELGISKENVHFKDDIFNESSVGKIEKIEEHEPIEKSKSIE
jgi:hypothetical protein